jgi:hypothetical protein
LGERDLPPLPHTTPHTLRRTYISIALLANNFDVKWVMGQVGHADSKMTMDVYAQLEQRVDRSHGTSFDRLVRRAREQVAGLPLNPDEGSNGRRLGDEAEKRPLRADSGPRKHGRKTAHLQRRRGMARVGIEPTTPRFSVGCFTRVNNPALEGWKWLHSAESGVPPFQTIPDFGRPVARKHREFRVGLGDEIGFRRPDDFANGEGRNRTEPIDKRV